MTLNSAIMLEVARQRHLDVADGEVAARRPVPGGHGSSPRRRPAYRTRLVLAAVVVGGTLVWGVFVTGLASLTPHQAKSTTGTAVTATTQQAQTTSVTRTRPARSREVPAPEKWY